MHCKNPARARTRCHPSRPVAASLPLRRGVAALEFAMVLPILVTILLGTTDFGRFAHSSIAIANAARSGAAYASMNPYDSSAQTVWTSGVRRSVTDELSQSTTFDLSKVVVNVVNVTESGGLRRTSVEVTYPFTTLINWPMLPSSISLQRTVVMRGIR